MSRKEEIQEKAKSLYYHFCVRETCGDEDDCTNCPYGKVIEPLVSMAKWADQNPRKGLWDAEKVCKWISERIGIEQKIETNSDGEPLADSYIAYCVARQNAADSIIKDLRKAMEEL